MNIIFWCPLISMWVLSFCSSTRCRRPHHFLTHDAEPMYHILWRVPRDVLSVTDIPIAG
jgi:hypothetical protein